MKAKPAITGMLGLVLVIGCGGTSMPSGQSPQDSVPAAQDSVANPQCVQQPMVTVHIENQGSYSIGIFFGSSQARTSVGPAETTEYEVSRSHLLSPIRLSAWGGLTGDPPVSIRTAPVACNDAILVIGPRPSDSYFIGNVPVKRPSGDSGR